MGILRWFVRTNVLVRSNEVLIFFNVVYCVRTNIGSFERNVCGFIACHVRSNEVPIRSNVLGWFVRTNGLWFVRTFALCSGSLYGSFERTDLFVRTWVHWKLRTVFELIFIRTNSQFVRTYWACSFERMGLIRSNAWVEFCVFPLVRSNAQYVRSNEPSLFDFIVWSFGFRLFMLYTYIYFEN